MLSAITKDVSLYRNAYLLTLSATMGQILTGWDIGMTGGILALPSFQQYFGLNKKSATERAALNGNFAGILSLGSFAGALVAAYFFGRFGRKPCLIASAILHVIGSLVESIAGIGSTANVGLRVLYFGRFLCGFGEGVIASVLTAYVAECVPPVIRGRCIGANLIAVNIGLMLSFWVNYGVSKHIATGEMQWRTPFIAQILPGILFALAMLFQHESPHWLVGHKRYEAAAKSLAFSNRTTPSDEKVTKAVDSIRTNLSEREKLSLLAQLKGMAKSRSTSIRCFIPCLTMLFTAFSGTSAINIFAPQIFISLGINATTSSLLATGVFGVVKVIAATVFAAFVAERIGRKNGLIIGGLGQGITMLWIGGYSSQHPSGKIVPSGYVSLVAIYLYAIFFCVGCGSAGYAVAAEVAPYHLRPVVLSIAGSILCLGMFATSKITPIMFNEITYGTYLFYGIICVIMAIWAYIFLPETTGYSLEDIKYLFERDIILRSLQDSPGGWIFIGKRRAKSVEELRIQDDALRKESFIDSPNPVIDVVEKSEKV